METRLGRKGHVKRAVLSVVRRLPASSLRVERVTVPVRGLPEGTSFRVVQLSDLHLSREALDDPGTVRILDEAVRAANLEEADAVVLTGDLVDFDPRPVLGDLERMVARLRARRGVYAVPGNHCYHYPRSGSVDEVLAAVSRGGARVLRNDSELLDLDGGARLAMVGLGDVWFRDCLPDEAFRGVPDEVPRVVLSHQPRSAEQIAARQRADLVLSGHTHGGQLAVPVSWAHLTGAPHAGTGRGRAVPVLRLLRYVYDAIPAALQRLVPGALRRTLSLGDGWRWDQGLHNISSLGAGLGGHLYVNRGLAHPRGRLFCDPEVTVLTLVPA